MGFCLGCCICFYVYNVRVGSITIAFLAASRASCAISCSTCRRKMSSSSSLSSLNSLQDALAYTDPNASFPFCRFFFYGGSCGVLRAGYVVCWAGWVGAMGYVSLGVLGVVWAAFYNSLICWQIGIAPSTASICFSLFLWASTEIDKPDSVLGGSFWLALWVAPTICFNFYSISSLSCGMLVSSMAFIFCSTVFMVSGLLLSVSGWGVVVLSMVPCMMVSFVFMMSWLSPCVFS